MSLATRYAYDAVGNLHSGTTRTFIDAGKTVSAPVASVTFDLSHHPTKLSMVEAIKGQSGWLINGYSLGYGRSRPIRLRSGFG